LLFVQLTLFSWHKIPFVRLLIPFILGVFWALYLPFGFYSCLAGFCVLVIVVLFLLRNKKTHFKFTTQVLVGILFTVCFITIGYLRTYSYNETRQLHHFSDFKKAKYYYITVEDAVIAKEKFYRCYASVNACKDSGGKFNVSQGNLLLYFKKNAVQTKPLVGNTYLISSNIQPILGPANPGEFNYKQYLTYHNIYYQQFTDSANTITLPITKPSVYSWALSLRDASLKIIKQYIPEEKEGGVAQALLLGYKDELDPDIVDAFSRTGTLHVLAVSGLHAGIIYIILSFLTKPLSKYRKGKIIQLVLLIGGIWLYAFVTGLSSSVLRASIMFSTMAIGKSLKYNSNIYNNLFASAFILLIYNPLFIVDVGFQLSYLAVLGIVFIQPLIKNWWLPTNWLTKQIWSLISISFAAQLLTFPIGVFYFHQFPNYFLLSNLLIIPITSIILIGLIALIGLSWIPYVGLILGKCIWVIIWFNNWLVIKIDELPYSYIKGIHFDFFQMILLYALMLFFLAFCIHKYKVLLTLTMLSLLIFSGYYGYTKYSQSQQRIMVAHYIKKHDVFTCLQGHTAYIFADSSFINDKLAIKFYLEPYFWAHGITEVISSDFNKTFIGTNIYYKKNSGLQFFDRIMTIQNNGKLNGIKHQFWYVKHTTKNYFNAIAIPQNNIVWSANIGFNKTVKLEQGLKNKFGPNFKLNKKATVIKF